MKKNLLTLTLLLSLFNISTAQNWETVGTTSFNRQVNAILSDNDNLYVGGDFWSGAYNYVAKWDGTSWSNLSGLFCRRAIKSIISDGNGNILATADDGNDGYFVAKWNGISWSVVGGTKFNKAINALGIDSEGNIYATGEFTNANNNKYVAKWDGTSWSQLGSFEPNNSVYALVVDSDANIYISGRFTNPDDFNTYVAKWDGTSWSFLDENYASSNSPKIESLSIDGNDNVYSASSSGVFKWNGSTWSQLGDAFTQSSLNFVSVAVDQAGENIYGTQASVYTDDNNTIRSYISKWNGTTWEQFGDVTNGYNSKKLNYTLYVDADNYVYANDFSVPTSTSAAYVSKYSPVIQSNNELDNSSINLTVYPNPANNFVNIPMEETGTVNFYNSTGQLVTSKPLKLGVNQILTNDLVSGVYNLKIIGAKNYNNSTVLIIE